MQIEIDIGGLPLSYHINIGTFKFRKKKDDYFEILTTTHFSGSRVKTFDQFCVVFIDLKYNFAKPNKLKDELSMQSKLKKATDPYKRGRKTDKKIGGKKR